MEAPYSGSEFDLLTGNYILQAEGKRLARKEDSPAGDPRAAEAYKALLEAATALLELVKKCRGRANKDLKKFTNQILSLTEKWK